MRRKTTRHLRFFVSSEALYSRAYEYRGIRKSADLLGILKGIIICMNHDFW